MEVEDGKNPNPKTSMKIKLMLNKSNRRVMYAEAGKEFVDLLISILTLPTASIVKLALRSDPSTNNSCITNLYNSVENLPHFVMNSDKSILLDPKIVSTAYTTEILNIQAAPPPPPKPPKLNNYYVCQNAVSDNSSRYPSNYRHNISTQPGAVQCQCGSMVNHEVNLVYPSPESKPEPPAQNGYVKKHANFVITNDLSIVHVNSTATIFNLWHKIGIKEPSELEERNVTVGANEVMGLLKAAMLSKTALNDVFENEQNWAKVAQAAVDTEYVAVEEQWTHTQTQLSLTSLREDQIQTLTQLLVKLVREDEKLYELVMNVLKKERIE